MHTIHLPTPFSVRQMREYYLRVFKTLFSFCCLFAIFVMSAQTAFSQQRADEDEPILLRAFEVESPQDLGYRKTVASTATRIGTEILETPLNISVVSKELLEDLARDNTVDLFNYTSSVKVSYDVPVGLSPGTVDDGFKIRGFSTTFGYQDGVRRPQGFYVDGIDRVEVIKGPVGLYFGRTEPGGIVNFVSKRPEFRDATQVRVGAGSDSYFKGYLDHQGTLGESKKIGYRLTASHRNSDDWQDYVHWNENYILSTVTYRPLPTMEMSFQYESLNQFRTGGRVSGLVANLDYNQLLADEQLPIGANGLAQSKNQWIQEVFNNTGFAPRSFNGYSFPMGHSGNVKGPGAFDDIESQSFLYDLKWKLADGLDLRAVFSRSESEALIFWPIEQEITRAPRILSALATGGNPNSATVVNFGVFASAFFDPSWPTAPGKAAPMNTTDTSQIDLSYDFEALGGKHTLVGSFEWIGTQGRNFGIPTDAEAFIRAGGIPGNASGLGNDPYSAEANAILMGHHQKLVNWGLLGPTQSFPFGERNFGGLYIDLATTEPPDASAYVPKERTENSTSGSDNIETGWSISYRGKYLDDRLTLLAGIRETSYKSVNARLRDGVDERTGAWEEFNSTTPTYGATFKLMEGLVAYTSYSETFLPTGQNRNELVSNQLTGATYGGDFTAPEVGEGWEVGLKSALMDYRLSGTLSLFSLSRANLIIGDPIRVQMANENDAAIAAGNTPPWLDENGGVIARNNYPTLNRNSGEETVEGVELEFIYTPVDNLQFITALTNYYTREISVPDPSIINVLRGGEFAPNPNDGRDAFPLDPLENVPEWMFSTWAKYAFTEGRLEGLSIGFGGNYQSEEVHETRNNTQFEAFTTGDWWRFDFMLGYKFKVYERPLHVRFNVNNVFDKEYTTGSFGPAPTRTWRISASYDF